MMLKALIVGAARRRWDSQNILNAAFSEGRDILSQRDRYCKFTATIVSIYHLLIRVSNCGYGGASVECAGVSSLRVSVRGQLLSS